MELVLGRHTAVPLFVTVTIQNSCELRERCPVTIIEANICTQLYRVAVIS